MAVKSHRLPSDEIGSLRVRLWLKRYPLILKLFFFYPMWRFMQRALLLLGFVGCNFVKSSHLVRLFMSKFKESVRKKALGGCGLLINGDNLTWNLLLNWLSFNNYMFNTILTFFTSDLISKFSLGHFLPTVCLTFYTTATKRSDRVKAITCASLTTRKAGQVLLFIFL